MKSTLIIVADSVRARIFTYKIDDSELMEIEDMSHPEGRLDDRDLSSDVPGKGSGAGSSSGHTHAAKSSPGKNEQIEFARRVNDYLEQARTSNKISKLLLFIAPSFLGELRTLFSKELKKLVVFEEDKNLAHLDTDSIKAHLPKSILHSKM